MTILTVGSGETYATLAAAVAASQDGDVIQVQAGTYTNDFAEIHTKITMEGVGGPVHLLATQPPPNGKAILVTDTDVRLTNLEFSGAQVADGNGAGVRYQGGNLTLNNCYLHDNQDGLLANADTTGSITINNSEFAHNGTGDGFTHNLYVGEVGTLTIDGSYFHDAVVGHEIKSRALTTSITNSRIVDGSNGTASYSIDLPDGGNATISHNIIEQGPRSQNPAIIHYGGEGGPYAGSSLSVSDNTILNDLASASARAILNATSVTASFTNNQVYGLTDSQIASGPVSEAGTTFLTAEPAICFLPGALIATPNGEVPVERLAVGDAVLTAGGGVEPVVWIGAGRVRATRGRRSAATPVIVRQGALADNVPHRDLRVTKGHAFYLDSVLIPVEFLVNHHSILWDDHAQDAELYHIELARHDVLLASGAPAESYRDDGNRWLFRNRNTGWGSDAVWRRLLDRAPKGPGVPVTEAPDLHLLVDGTRVDGRKVANGVYRFALATPGMRVQIVSRAGVPAELGLARDPRALGVALRRIILRQGARVRVMEASDPRLADGFHGYEADARSRMGFRWTDGDAVVPAALLDAINGACDLELQVAETTHYPLLGIAA